MRREPRTTRVWLVALLAGAAAFGGLLLVRPHGISRDHDWLLHAARYAFLCKSVFEFGQFPFWSPYFGGGMPVLGDPAGAELTPQAPFALAFGEVVGLKVFVVCLVVLQAGGMYAFLRRGLRLGAWPAAFGAWLLTCASNLPMRNWDELAYGWLPLMLWLLVLMRTRPRAGAWLAVVLAATLPGGKQCWALLVLYLAAFVCLHAVVLGRRRLTVAPKWGAGFAACVVAAALLAGAKVLPMAELLRDRHELGMAMIRNKAPFYGPSTVDALTPGALARGLAASAYEPGVGMRSSVCVGYAALAFVALGIVLRWRRLWRMAALGGLAAVAVTGWHSQVDLLRLLWLVPGLDTMRASAKYLDYFVCLTLCACAAAGLAATLRSRGAWRWAAIGLSAAAAVETAAKNAPAVLDQFRFPRPAIAKAESFYYRLPVARGPAAVRTPKGTTYFNLLAGLGTLNWESGLGLPEHAEPRELIGPRDEARANPWYRGEVYFAEGSGEARLACFSPNRLVVLGESAGPATVVVNQNWHAGWRLGSVDGAVVLSSRDGKLALRLGGPGRFEAELRFVPWGFYWGCAVSAVAWLALVLCCWRLREVWRRQPPARVAVRRAWVIAVAALALVCGIGWWWRECGLWSAADAEYELGRQCYVSGSVGGASRHFERALAMRPCHQLACKRLGQCRYWQGDFVGAARLFEQSRDMLVLESDDVIMATVAWCASGQAGRARDALARWSDAAPLSPHVWTSRAALMVHEGDIPAARASLQRAMDLGLRDMAALRRWGAWRAVDFGFHLTPRQKEIQ